MSDSQVIARKFRPKTFEQVVGQEAITRTLSNAITTDRLHHAYLFAGARGVGKTTTARIFARALNCHKGITPDPCGECASCREIASSSSIDVLEIDAASNTGVENVREVIINTVQISPARDRYKIFIIDEVHQLSGPAFNALLKTLEEPPPRVAFIMATTEMHKVPDTILSRCQIFEFRTITLKKIFDQLRRIADELGVKISDAALLGVARAGEGSMRDAESALDQVISFAGLEVADEDVSAALGLVDIETLNTTVQAVGDQDALEVLRIVEETVSRGYDLRNFCRELMAHLRALLVTKIAGFDSELLQLPPGEGETITRLAENFSEQDLVRFFSILTKTEQDIRVSSHPRFQLEIGLMKLLHASRLYLLEEVLDQFQELQVRLDEHGMLPPGGTAPRSPSRESGKPDSAAGMRPVRQATGKITERSARPSQSRSAPAPPPTEIREKKEVFISPPAPFVENAAAPRRTESATPRSSDPFEETPTLMAKPDGSDAPGATSVSPQASEPPSMFDGPEDMEPLDDFPSDAVATGAGAVERIKAAIEGKRKMMLFSALDKAERIEIDGEFLRISYAAGDALFKNQVESRDNRKLIEEVCREVTGRRLTLSATVGGQAGTESAPRRKERIDIKERVENNPAVRALADKFQGQVIEVLKPEN
ncbi:MAG: DNA polymerase III subunit gamma/tau [Blastocatellia bacterium]|nr:DNA polymerase III subunit gamma/tau [Blastocatellia bacterium]